MNRMSGGDDFILSLKSITEVFFRRLWIILLAVIVTVGLAMTLSLLQTPQYESSVRMLVGQDQGITDSPTEAIGLQQLTQTMAVAADSRPVAEAVISELNLDMTTEDFFSNLSVEQVASTQFIEITYRSPDPEEAQRIANATGEAFSQEISSVGEGTAAITAVLYEQADLSEDPVVPDFFRNGAISLILGLMLGAGIAFLLELIDDRWASPEEAENVLDVPVFGVIPVFEPASGEESERIRTVLKEPNKKEKAIPALVAASAISAKGAKGEDSPSTNGSHDSLNSRSNGVQLLPAAGEGGVVWPVGMLLLDGEGRVEEADATLLRMLGRSSDEVAGEEFAGLFSHPEDAEKHRAMQETLASGEQGNYSLEKRIIGEDGQISWFEVTVCSLQEDGGAGRAAMAMVEDITRLKQAQELASLSGEAKKISDERLRTVMGNSPLTVSFFTPDGYSLSEDESWHSLWHELWYEPGESNGESVLENERIKNVGLDRYFRESLDSRSDTVTPPLRLERPGAGTSGEEGREERWLRAFIKPVTDDSGGVREVMMMLEDLTEQKNKEARSEEEVESLGEIRAALAEREESLRESEARREEVESRLRNFEQGMGEAEVAAIANDEKRLRLEESLRQSEESRAEIQTKLDESEQGRGEFEAVATEREESLRKLEGELKQYEAQRQEAEEKLLASEGQVSELEARVRESEESISGFEAELLKKEESRKRLEESLRQSEENNEQNKAERVKLEEELFEKEDGIQRTEASLRQSEDRRAEMQGELDRSEAQHEELRQRVEAAEAEKLEVERRLTQIQSKLGAILSSGDL